MPVIQGRLGDEMRGKWEGGKNDLVIEMVERTVNAVRPEKIP